LRDDCGYGVNLHGRRHLIDKRLLPLALGCESGALNAVRQFGNGNGRKPDLRLAPRIPYLRQDLRDAVSTPLARDDDTRIEY